MKYMLLAYGNEEKSNQMSKDELAEIGEKCQRFDAEMQAAGEVTWGGSLSWGIELRPINHCLAIREAETACIS